MATRQRVWEAFVEIKAEDTFKDAMRMLARQVTVQQVHQMAKLNIHAADVFYEELTQIARSAPVQGVAYLASLSDEKVLYLIDQAAPAHGAALKADMRYAAQLSREIRGIIGMVLREKGYV